jgi:uncharacterized protein
MTNARIAAGRRIQQFSGITLALVLALSAPAQAADEAARQAAAELMALTNVEQTLGMVRQQIDETMAAQLKAMDVPAHLQSKVDAYQKKVSSLVSKEMSFASMKADYVDAYVTVFTTEELEGLVAFYKTPTGKAFVDKQPQLTQKLIGLAQQRMEKIAPEVQKLNQELVAQMQKEADKAKK